MIGNQAYQKTMNLALVMRAIRDVPGISRTEIATATGLTKSTVGNLVRELTGRGLVGEHRTGNGGGAGRPRVGLTLASRTVRVLGAELRSDSVAVVTVRLDGSVESRFREVIPDGEHSLKRAWRAVRSVLGTIAPAGCIGLGLAVPATTDPIHGRVLDSEDFDVRGFAAEPLVTPGGTCPVVLENDANAVAWGALGTEDRSTRPGGIDLLAVIGRRDAGALRVGTAVVIGSRVYYGADFGGGEFRSSGWRSGMHVELASATAPDVRDALVELLANLSVPISMLRPRRVVLGGDLVTHRGTIDAILADELAGAYVDPRVSGVPFEAAPEGEYAAAAGGARMFLEHLFAVPAVDVARPDEIPSWQEIGNGGPEIA